MSFVPRCALFMVDTKTKQIVVQQVSDFSFSEHDSLRVVAQLGSLRQCTRAFCPKESTSIQSNMLLPVEQVPLLHSNRLRSISQDQVRKQSPYHLPNFLRVDLSQQSFPSTFLGKKEGLPAIIGSVAFASHVNVSAGVESDAFVEQC